MQQSGPINSANQQSFLANGSSSSPINSLNSSVVANQQQGTNNSQQTKTPTTFSSSSTTSSSSNVSSTGNGRSGSPRQQQGGAAPTPRYKPLCGPFAGPDHLQDQANLVFRKVRGILNKLTPENFDKLSRDLLNVGLDSTHVLKGVILLIFEKALDEAKYSLMYASLCRTLCQDAPNFDPPPANTFRRLLLAKCQDEFDNRKKAHHDAPIHSEQRSIAKQKMLGNMRLIGELGKQGLLHEKILHECLQTLLKGKKHEDVDLECLCHMVRTVGTRLDTSKGRALVDQYFERMVKLYSSEGIPARIKFMLQDVCELRKNGWMPRRRANIGNLQQPTTLANIRNQVMPPMMSRQQHSHQNSSNGHSHGHHGQGHNHQDHHGGRGSHGIGRRDHSFNDDIFYGQMKKIRDTSSPTSNDYGDLFDSKSPSSIMSNSHNNNNLNGGNNNRDNRHRDNRYSNGHRDNHFNHHNNQRNNGGGGGNNGIGGMQLPLRLLKNNLPQQLDELSLRPNSSPQSLLKPKSMPPPGAQLAQNNFARNNQSLIQAVSVKPTVSTSLPIKAEPKPKVATRAEYQEKVLQLIEENAKKEAPANFDQVCDEIGALEVPKKFMSDILMSYSVDTLKKESPSLDNLEKLVTRFSPNGVSDLLPNVLRKMPGTEACARNAAELVVNLLLVDQLDFSDVALWNELPSSSDDSPWIMTVLSLLLSKEGEEKLMKRCGGVNLLPHLPPSERNEAGLASSLEKHGLNCLQPLNMRLEKQLVQCLPSVEAVTQFVESLDDQTKQSSDFVLALVTVIMRYAFKESSKEDEEKALAPFTSLLQKYCANQMGMWALYAVQKLWDKKGCPKDVLLRWFVFFYYADVVEDAEFFRWKEDVTVDFAGKGKGLFQVNNWLDWLAENDEEEDEAGE